MPLKNEVFIPFSGANIERFKLNQKPLICESGCALLTAVIRLGTWFQAHLVSRIVHLHIHWQADGETKNSGDSPDNDLVLATADCLKLKLLLAENNRSLPSMQREASGHQVCCDNVYSYITVPSINPPLNEDTSPLGQSTFNWSQRCLHWCMGSLTLFSAIDNAYRHTNQMCNTCSPFYRIHFMHNENIHLILSQGSLFVCEETCCFQELNCNLYNGFWPPLLISSDWPFRIEQKWLKLGTHLNFPGVDLVWR